MAAKKISFDQLAKISPPYLLLDTVKKDKNNQKSFLFNQVKKILRFNPGDSPAFFFRQAQNYLSRGYWLSGYFNYEFGYFLEDYFSYLQPKTGLPLACLAVCRPPQEIIIDDSKQKESGYYWVKRIRPNINQKEYGRGISKIKQFLEQGLTYQVNYTFKMKFELEGDPLWLYRNLRRSQPTAYAALIDFGCRQPIFSFSPELFIRVRKNEITTAPMKGTIKRGKTAKQDLINRQKIKACLKTKAENLMITDLLRNDLGRIAGQVETKKLFKVEKYKTLYQMVSLIKAKLGRQADLEKLFTALFPSGSVTGAPKIKTMEIINQLEKEPRNVYTGVIGYISPAKKACFNVAIRTISLDKGKGELGVGGGIVYDSQKDSEYQEALLKADFFIRQKFSFHLLEAMLWQKNRFWLYQLHMQRLKQACCRFEVPFRCQDIRRELNLKVKRLKGPAKVRLLLDSAGNPQVKAEKLARISFPVKAKIASEAVDSQDPFLYYKTSRRQVYHRQRAEALKEGFFEVIFFNQKKEVTEGSISNVFIEKKGQLFTPPVACGLLAGVFRQHLLKNKKVKEKVIRLRDIETSDKLYLGNSVRGLIPAEIKKPNSKKE